jgi:DNA-binding MarR family transcriptional regulator
MANINTFKNKIHAQLSGQKKQSNITHAQWFVLNMIQAHQNLGIKELSKMLGISSSAATQLVDGLVKQRYVVRKINQRDKRGLQLQLSLKGKKDIVTIKKKYAKIMEGLFASLSDKELEVYHVLHQKILSKFKNKYEYKKTIY